MTPESALLARSPAVLAGCVSLSVILGLAGAPASAQEIAADGPAIVRALREARERMSLDARARLTTISPDGRSVVRLRIRARGFDGVYKTLVEVTDTDRVGGMLAVADGADLRITAWQAPSRTTPPVPEVVPPTARLAWLSPCATVEDLADAHLWWLAHDLAGEEPFDSRQAYVIVSRPPPAAITGYRTVRSWIDRERLVPLRVERTMADGTVTVSTTVRVRRRDGQWLPERTILEAGGTGCRAEMTVVGGTTRATLDASIFEVVR